MHTIPLFKVYMNKDVNEPLLETLHSGWVGQGDKVKEFESVLSDRVGNPYCLSLSCGTHGLHLALRMLGVGAGDEVITTPLTCTATNWPILMQGADIVWADVSQSDLNIDPESVKEKMTDKTKAVIAVHWGGYPCDLDRISSYSVPVVEDAAHAFGATFKDTKIGDCAYSSFVMFSFQAIKNPTCVDGGALFCAKEKDYRLGKLLRWYGIDREGPRIDMRCERDIEQWGYKYHMNDVNATIGLSNLTKVDWAIQKHRDNASYYDRELSSSDVKLLQQKKDRRSSGWLYTVLVEDRSGFSRMMGEKGVMVSRVHSRTDKHSCVEKYKTQLPGLESIMDKMICIPVGWWVTEEDREYIVDSIKGGW